jgi:hypothetical protein
MLQMIALLKSWLKQKTLTSHRLQEQATQLVLIADFLNSIFHYEILCEFLYRLMTTRNSSTDNTFFQRRNSVKSEVDSDYQAFKEEFEQKE